MPESFSDRIGITEKPSVIYVDSVPDALRNSLWNFIHGYFESRYDRWIALARFVAKFYLKVPVDELPIRDYECRKWIKNVLYSSEWHEVYNLIEFLVSYNSRILSNPPLRQERLIENYNLILERESSGFRFISGVLAPISNSAEALEVTEAIAASQISGMTGAHAHLNQAVVLLGQKPEPDYRNAIKEAVSAVESMARLLANEANADGLAGALRELSKKVEIHPALQAGFIKLYGYTSDEDGIRHAILDKKEIGYEEAKFMVVSCSAFVNFLITNGAKGQLI